MNFIKTESTLLTTCSSDSFMKFPYDEASIQNLSISINIKKEDSHSDDEFYNSINPSTLVNYQIDNLMNIKTEPDGIRSMQYNTEIFSQPLLSKMSDPENSVNLKLNQQSTSIFKNESIDIKDENHYTLDSSPLTFDLETSLISIKDESHRELKNFNEASSDEYLIKSGNTFCDICGKDFSSSQNLKRHYIEIHLTKENYICDMCNKSFRQKRYLKYHVETIHLKIKDWKCIYCNKSFTKKSSLRYHERVVHLNIQELKCNLCDRYFASKTHLKTHSRVHLRDSSEVCEICNKSFRFLQHHKNRVHSESKKKCKCTHCDELFYTNFELNRHVQTHSITRDWKCKICVKSFKLKSSLVRHEKIHSRNGSHISANSSKSNLSL